MTLVARKPVFNVPDHVKHKPIGQLQRLTRLLKRCMYLV